MKTALALSAAGLALALGPGTFETRYGAERQFRVESVTSLSMETVEFVVERDGERVEAPRGGGSSRAVHRVSHVDRFLKLDADGAPQVVRRTFSDVGGSRTVTMGDNEFDADAESPFDGLVVEFTRKGSGAEAKVVEGRRPEAPDALEGHALTLVLDALLPGKEVAEGAKWDLDGDAIRHALGIDLTRKLFPRPAPEERGGGEERGRGGRGGGRMFGGGGGAGDLLGRAEWSGTAKLVDLDHDHDGLVCARIELELEGRGELPERPAFGGGRGERGGRALEVRELGGATSNDFRIELTGSLLFAVEARRPVRLELEGSLRTERDQEMSGRGGGSMRMRHVEEGTLRHVVNVAEDTVAAD